MKKGKVEKFMDENAQEITGMRDDLIHELSCALANYNKKMSNTFGRDCDLGQIVCLTTISKMLAEFWLDSIEVHSEFMKMPSYLKIHGEDMANKIQLLLLGQDQKTSASNSN